MIYLIIIIAVAFVIMPVFWLKPSPAQKRQAELRQQAMSKGLLVKVCDMPQSHRAQVRNEAVTKGVVYRLPINGKDGTGIIQRYLLQKTEAGMEYSGENDRIKQSLEQALTVLPDSIAAVECNPTSVGAYWRERGSKEDVDSIFQTLHSLREKLLAQC